MSLKKTAKNRIQPLLLVAGLLAPMSLMANGNVPTYYWDNQAGLVQASNCTLEPLHETKFRVSSFFGNKTSDTENLRNHGGVRQSHLINGSLIKFIDGPVKDNYEYIEVVGVNSNPEVAQTRWFSERLDKGYLFERSINPIEDYVFELSKDTPADKLPGNEEQSVKGSYWKVLSDQHYLSLKCADMKNERDYLVFHVYKKDHAAGPVARVGVYWDETNIFRSMRSMTTERALEFLPTLREDDRLDLVMQEAETEEVMTEDVGAVSEEEAELTEEIKVSASAPAIVTDESLHEEKSDKVATPEVTGISNVVCIGSDTLNVRGDDLNEVLFRAKKGEVVKVFQGWNENEKEGTIGSKTYKFLRVEFSDREESDEVIGWVAEEYVKTKEECPYTNGSVIVRDSSTTITGIDDPNCCEFPTMKKVTHSFTSGMRRFNAGRGGGSRLHAASDLYRYKDEPIMAVAPGTIVRDRYYFYQGTYALEVKHTGGFIVRYGELTGKQVSGVSKGRGVRMGDRLGYIGLVNSGCCRPMLHFELYSGKKSGALTQSGNKYQRRSDLMDPTPYLLRWESEKF